jgi:multidrug resistance efflux pump
MKKPFAILLVLLNTNVFAQTLEEAKTNLANAETALATQEAAVKAAQANVAALTPPVYWEKV